MNKRLLSYILILVMVFGATAPCYAEAWTTNDVYYLRQDVSNMYNEILAIGRAFYGSLGTMYNSVSEMMSWLSPQGNFGTGGTISGLTLYEILDYIAWNIDTDWNSEFAQLNTLPSVASYLSDINNVLINKFYNVSANTGISNSDAMKFAHRLFLHKSTNNNNLWSGMYGIDYVQNNGVNGLDNIFWQYGSPLGNIALLLQYLNQSVTRSYQYRWSADLNGYNATLGIWDSQQDSLTQETWVPQSAINGLYKYLAYLQRDVARMTFVLSSPEEQAAMENANESGVSAMYGDLYDDSNGGVTLSDMSDTFNTGKVAKQTFNSGVSFSTNGLFSFTDDEGWGFWSQAVMNDMDNVPQTRDTSMLKSSIKEPEYDMSAYEDRLGELLKIYNQEVVVDD